MTPVRDVVVVGGGLAGLAAAVSALEHGARVRLFERNGAPGGATRDSAGWIWRYRDIATARTCAPRADPGVQAAIVERLDADLEWLVSRGVVLRARGTGRAITDGARVDPIQLVDVLAAQLDRHGDGELACRRRVIEARRAAGGGLALRVEDTLAGALRGDLEWHDADAVVFAGGGYAADLGRVAHESNAPPDAAAQWVLRAASAGDGSSMDAALGLGAMRVPASGESFVRLVPDTSRMLPSRELARIGELQLPETQLLDADGTLLSRARHDWSGAQVAWTLATATGSGRLQLPRALLRRGTHAGTVEDAVRAAIDAGAASGRSDDESIWIAVRAGITHTMCGLRVDADARLLGPADAGARRRAGVRAIHGAWAAGCDAAGTGLGGTASGLAQALVLGRRAGALAARGA